MSRIELRDIRKVYPTGVVAVDGVSLTVDDGETLALLGPTGCGKSTILRMIAGLEQPTAGELRFDGETVDKVPVRERTVAMVFQDYALYPHLTVAENIAFPLATMDERRRADRIAEVSEMLGIAGVLHRLPAQLSGGQRQRVAMARAIVRPPRALLLDQPLANLDASGRDAVRGDIARLVRDLGVATIYVTHDHTEALTVGDRVAVMRRGRLEQVGTPAAIYSDPQRIFVAAFVGSPRMNLLQAAVFAEPEVRAIIDLGTQTLDVPWHDPRARALAKHHTARITVGVRPDALTAVTDGSARESTDHSGDGTLHGVVRSVELRGHDALVHLETGCAPTPHDISQLKLPDAPGELADAVSEPVPRVAMRQRLRLRIPRQRPSNAMRYAFQPSYDPQRA